MRPLRPPLRHPLPALPDHRGGARIVPNGRTRVKEEMHLQNTRDWHEGREPANIAGNTRRNQFMAKGERIGGRSDE
ncbi:MAG: hypothetical protein M3354_08880 [Chloroflexota bacterium]|nr:hypothetical protein [Chloroflexota bacterium]